MTAKPPYLVVAGFKYAEPDVLGRLPLRAFLVDAGRMREASAMRLCHPEDRLKFRWELRFSSYHRQVRLAGALAKKLWIARTKIDEAIVALRPRAKYCCSFYGGKERGWLHRFDIHTKLFEKSHINVRFEWNHLIERTLGESVYGTYVAQCLSCGDGLELSATLFVDAGAITENQESL